ncbi:acyl-CoA dehydrogenase family protein [Pseudonocardia xishanensis]|uniref:acyl-CoA dehydrogenase family protein n=1 Tax=Pseudonocardia xishanensis TaxID=630995 RepID=UPI0031EAA7ED
MANSRRAPGERAHDWLLRHAAAYAGGEPAEADLDTARALMRELHRAGLLGVTWPTSAGGAGASEDDERAIVAELSRYQLPLRPFRVGLGTVGPTIVDIGTESQRARLCPGILAGEHVWCQLFSEPEAGSDLAGLRARAVPVDGGYRVAGRKVWTSGAETASHGALLARTDPDRSKHRGLTMLMLDMRQPGVTVSPLRDMSGRTHFNEVLLEDAFVPDDMVLGRPDDGWAVASRMLQHERVAVARGVGRDGAETRSVSFANVLRLHREHGDPRADVRADLVALFVGEHLVDLLKLRMSQEAEAGMDLGARESMAKLLLGRQDIEAARSAVRILGPTAVFDGGDADSRALILAVTSSPSLSIAGGTEEIQKNIVGERILGLPREPSTQQGRTFREIIAEGRAIGGGN